MNPAAAAGAAPPPSSSSASPDSTTSSAAAAALRGASLAFQKTTSTKKPAATAAAAATPGPSPSRATSAHPPRRPDVWSSRTGDGGSVAAALSAAAGASASASASPSASASAQSKSPARAAPPRVHGTGSSSPAEVEALPTMGQVPHQGLVAARLHQLAAPSSSPSSSSSPSAAPLSAAVLAQQHMAQQHQHAPQLHFPTGGSGNRAIDPKSPSFIAATLAASRSVSPGPKMAAPALRRKGSAGAASTLSAGSDAPVDSGSIAPTGSLISMFEKTHSDHHVKGASPPRNAVGSAEEARRLAVGRYMAAPPRTLPSPPPPTPPSATAMKQGKRVESLPRRPPTPPPPVKTQKPLAVSPPEPRPKSQHAKSRSVDASRPNPKPKPQDPKTRQPSPPPAVETPKEPIAKPATKPAKPPVKPLRIQPVIEPSVVRSAPEVLSPTPVRYVKPRLTPTVVLSPQGSRASPQVLSSPSPSPDPQKRSPKPPVKAQPPTPPKPRGSHRLAAPDPAGSKRPRTSSTTSRGQAKSEARRPPSPRGSLAVAMRGRLTPPSLPARRLSVASAPSTPAMDIPRGHAPNASPSNLQLDSLTSAIMAGSLASSRLTPHNTGSSLPPPSLPKRQRSPHLLQTLRQPPSQHDEDSERNQPRGNRHKLQRGKHKHHEGSRKRWREEMTVRERKRYEAVWASNRGILLEYASPTRSVASGLGEDSSQCVANVVVREIWKRSRLPEDELAEVWDVVDRERRGMLSKQEFVVGLWLIDQRLRGRKIPQRVTDSMWGSANGVMVRKPKGR